MSTSEDMSDTSNMEIPFSHTESPYSSPSQQVPQLANFMTVLSCGDDVNMQHAGTKPYLRIIEQPQNHFRFRYKSEMIGTHGCLLGKSVNTTKTKTHPTVELVNYKGPAIIRCRLAQYNNTEEHPHKLLEDDQDKDVSTQVPEHGSYKVGFAGMGIIHTAKKDVPLLLFKKMVQQPKINNNFSNEKELRTYCENKAKNINLNIVRLVFSAHDVSTDAEICKPVYSEPIHNMKSAATNDLKICRISKCSGRPAGGDDVFILVEKVNKKNIMIRFTEYNGKGEVEWTEQGHFLQTDVHHQYAIVFRTPAYKDLEISSDVKVYIELVRPSDGRSSEPKEFTYKAQPIFRQSKKRKYQSSSYSSLDGTSDSGSINSISGLPTTIELINKTDLKDEPRSEQFQTYINLPHVPQVPSNNDALADAIYEGFASNVNEPINYTYNMTVSPMLGKPNVPEPPVLQFNSSEIDRLLKNNSNISPEEKKKFSETDFTDYFKSFGDSLPDEHNPMEFLRCGMGLVSDSGRGKGLPRTQMAEAVTIKKEPECKVTSPSKEAEYSAVYKAEDGVEVKKLVKELCEIIKNKTGYKKQEVRDKLERLFDIRLSNGDTFLHMTLCSNQPSLQYIVKLIHTMKMTHLLNLRNNQMRTILHLAILNDLPDVVSFLVGKGCNPMVDDDEGNNAVHYAVIYKTCLDTLLDSIKTHQVSCDLNAYNNEKQTALHLGTIYGSAKSVRKLLASGASPLARDSQGRTPLHLAAYDDALPVLPALLDHMHLTDVDVLDGSGHTALQIVCGGTLRPNSMEILKLLLEKKADPLKHEEYTQSAWILARNKPEIIEIMGEYVNASNIPTEDVKSEPEDDYESADEGEASEWSGVTWCREAGEAVRGSWRVLAERTHRTHLAACLARAPCPAAELLHHLRECDDEISPKQLVNILEDIKEYDAANIIKRHLKI